MSTPAEFDLSPRFECETLFGKAAEAPLDRRPLTGADLEESFQSLREECTRTLTLMRELRSSHFYQFASMQFDDEPDWPSWPA